MAVRNQKAIISHFNITIGNILVKFQYATDYFFTLLNFQNIYLIPQTLFSLVPWLHRYKYLRSLLYPYAQVYPE